MANGKTDYKPKIGLPNAVVDIVNPIYDALSDDSLLSRFLDSYTQNPNESLNILIWKRCQKNIYKGKKVVELCTASAVAPYKYGASSIAKVLMKMGIQPDSKTMAGILKTDSKRISVAQRQSSGKNK